MSDIFDLHDIPTFDIDKNLLLDGEIIIDGIPCCEKCKTPTRWIAPTGEWCKCTCECEMRKIEEKKKRQKLAEQRRLYDQISELSIIGERYKNTSFDDTDKDRNDSFVNAMKHCQKYCNAENAKKGIYLHGAVGTGKTHLLACIHNYLKSNGYPVLLTKIDNITKFIRKSYEGRTTVDEIKIMNLLYTIPYLFLDDLGEDNFTKKDGQNFTQDVLKNIVDERYRRNKPTCFSSNYKISELLNRGIEQRTVDRIVEMTKIIEITGDSYRMRGLRK